MTLLFDTSGCVGFYDADEPYTLTWSDLSPFTQGYVEAMFAELCARPCCPEIATHRWPEFGQGGRRPCERCGLPVIPDMGRNSPALAFSDLAPETLARIIEYCSAVEAPMPPRHRTPVQGRDCWRARQAGLMTFPPLAPYVGEDGKVYLKDAA